MGVPLVSIALCTYNGAAYLKEQLDSLINQTYTNLEIIAVDDRSSDNTIEILHRYASDFPGRNIKVYSNEQNLGYTRNFEKAIGLCTGEYIALCDQDDIWDTDKINIMLGLIGNQMLAYHDSEFVDEEGKPTGKKISDVRNCYSGSDSRVFLFENCVLGHATIFKREMLNFLDRFNDTVIHDRWLAYVATNNGSILFVDQPLVKYRQHRNANTNILQQERVNTSKSNSVYKMQFQLDIATVLVNYPFNTDLPFKQKLLGLMQQRMHSYTSFRLAYFVFIHRKVLFYIPKKSALSKFNMILKFIWGYKIKSLSMFNVDR